MFWKVISFLLLLAVIFSPLFALWLARKPKRLSMADRVLFQATVWGFIVVSLIILGSLII